jgi:acyl carrier protein
MTREDFLRNLERELKLPERSLNESQALTEVDNWDSMAAVLFIALADEKMGVTISGHQVAKSRTLADLLSLLGDTVSA